MKSKQMNIKQSCPVNSLSSATAAARGESQTQSGFLQGYLPRPEGQNLSPIKLQPYEDGRNEQKDAEGLNGSPRLHHHSGSYESQHEATRATSNATPFETATPSSRNTGIRYWCVRDEIYRWTEVSQLANLIQRNIVERLFTG
ncbi:hypothetical protein TNCV_2269751 [Trichonephila clavipes]|nr:hypothetical protein TNCV_2269751 [Trichonephila clavipes]